METKTLDELKLMGAKRLPEELDFLHNFSAKKTYIFWIKKPNRCVDVKETEWDYIVDLLEEKMKAKEQIKYISQLAPLCLGHDSMPITLVGIWLMTHATPEQKLTAMHKSGFLKD